MLLVEDEALLAMSIEDMLHDAGCIVVGPALSASDGEALAAREPLDAAVLDINLSDGRSFNIADVLRERSVPFCFSTGYGATGVPIEYAGIPVLPKPYSEASLKAVLAALMS